MNETCETCLTGLEFNKPSEIGAIGLRIATVLLGLLLAFQAWTMLSPFLTGLYCRVAVEVEGATCTIQKSLGDYVLEFRRCGRGWFHHEWELHTPQCLGSESCVCTNELSAFIKEMKTEDPRRVVGVSQSMMDQMELDLAGALRKYDRDEVVQPRSVKISGNPYRFGHEGTVMMAKPIEVEWRPREVNEPILAPTVTLGGGYVGTDAQVAGTARRKNFRAAYATAMAGLMNLTPVQAFAKHAVLTCDQSLIAVIEKLKQTGYILTAVGAFLTVASVCVAIFSTKIAVLRKFSIAVLVTVFAFSLMGGVFATAEASTFVEGLALTWYIKLAVTVSFLVFAMIEMVIGVMSRGLDTPFLDKLVLPSYDNYIIQAGKIIISVLLSITNTKMKRIFLSIVLLSGMVASAMSAPAHVRVDHVANPALWKSVAYVERYDYLHNEEIIRENFRVLAKSFEDNDVFSCSERGGNPFDTNIAEEFYSSSIKGGIVTDCKFTDSGDAQKKGMGCWPMQVSEMGCFCGRPRGAVVHCPQGSGSVEDMCPTTSRSNPAINAARYVCDWSTPTATHKRTLPAQAYKLYQVLNRLFGRLHRLALEFHKTRPQTSFFIAQNWGLGGFSLQSGPGDDSGGPKRRLLSLPVHHSYDDDTIDEANKNTVVKLIRKRRLVAAFAAASGVAGFSAMAGHSFSTGAICGYGLNTGKCLGYEDIARTISALKKFIHLQTKLNDHVQEQFTNVSIAIAAVQGSLNAHNAIELTIDEFESEATVHLDKLEEQVKQHREKVAWGQRQATYNIEEHTFLAQKAAKWAAGTLPDYEGWREFNDVPVSGFTNVHLETELLQIVLIRMMPKDAQKDYTMLFLERLYPIPQRTEDPNICVIPQLKEGHLRTWNAREGKVILFKPDPMTCTGNIADNILACLQAVSPIIAGDSAGLDAVVQESGHGLLVEVPTDEDQLVTVECAQMHIPLVKYHWYHGYVIQVPPNTRLTLSSDGAIKDTMEPQDEWRILTVHARSSFTLDYANSFARETRVYMWNEQNSEVDEMEALLAPEVVVDPSYIDPQKYSYDSKTNALILENQMARKRADELNKKIKAIEGTLGGGNEGTSAALALSVIAIIGVIALFLMQLSGRKGGTSTTTVVPSGGRSAF